ncbi:MAG: ABC transporter ATP-binding protein [Haloferacaceae archaeon]
MGGNSTLLETKNLTKRFEGLVAVDDVSVSFDEDELHAIIGPNGAGKTTFFNLLTGTLQPSDGQVLFQGEDVTDLPPEQIARRGMIRSYQIQQLFLRNSVLENVRIAVQSNYNSYNFWQKADDKEEITEKARGILDRVGLSDKAEEDAQNLSHGEQRTLELAISLGPDPDLLLLDEPTSGMNAEETTGMIELIDDLADDVAIVLVEHKMSVVKEVADHIIVLHNGQRIADGSYDEVRTDEQVKRVYLGGN